MSKLASIQLVRAIACLLVLWLHIAMFIPDMPFFVAGDIGVDLFFIISGYIIASSVDKMSPEKKALNFAINRFSRVVPYYWLITVLYATAIAIYTGTTDFNQLWTSLFFFPGEPITPIGWSLNHEVFFYLFIVACLLLTRRVNHWFNLAAFITLILCCRLSSSGSLPVKFMAASINLTFALGYFIFLMEKHLVKYFQSRLVLAGLGLLFVFLLLFSGQRGSADSYPRDLVMYLGQFIVPRFTWGIACGALFVAVLAQEQKIKAGRFALAIRIGDISYSVYLIQALMIIALHIMRPLPLWSFPLIFVFTVFISFGMYRVENLLGKAAKRGSSVLLGKKSVAPR